MLQSHLRWLYPLRSFHHRSQLESHCIIVELGIGFSKGHQASLCDQSTKIQSRLLRNCVHYIGPKPSPIVWEPKITIKKCIVTIFNVWIVKGKLYTITIYFGQFFFSCLQLQPPWQRSQHDTQWKIMTYKKIKKFLWTTVGWYI